MDLAQREPEGWRGWRWDCRWKQATELSRCEWVKADVRPILREGREERQEVTKHRQDFSDRREGEGQEGQEAATISCMDDADLGTQTPHGTRRDEDRTGGTRADTRTPRPHQKLWCAEPARPGVTLSGGG